MKRQLMPPAIPEKTQLRPGFTLAQIIDQFYAEGVVPDFIPADLGDDAADEVDPETGFFLVDPDGRIDIDPMDRREAALLAGIKDPDSVPSPTLPAPPAPAPEPPTE